VDTKTGIVTTSCILFHEIPHEIGDFAILMKSGFNKYEAAKLQFYTASVGVLGALGALAINSMDWVDDITSWIIPFTSGGFIQISLVAVLPDLLVVPKSGPGGAVADLIRVLSRIGLGISVMLILSKL
jgi:zinc transporter 13